jgi:hypothetical protein
MRIAKLEGECPHEPLLRGNLNKVNAVNMVKIRVPSPVSKSILSILSIPSILSAVH